MSIQKKSTTDNLSFRKFLICIENGPKSAPKKVIHH